MKNKMYQIIIGELLPPKEAIEATPETTAQPATLETYNPDKRSLMVVAKDVAEAIGKVTLEATEHVESVTRHNFIDVV